MFKIKNYIGFETIVSRVSELENLNRTIDYSVLSSLSLIQNERTKEFISTNTIEGDQVSFKKAKAMLREKLTEKELEKRWIGIVHASKFVWSDNFEFSLQHVHEAHRGLMREVSIVGGIYKSKINKVGSLITSHPDDVPLLMNELYYTLLSEKVTDGLSVYNIIPFISEFLAIHPYEDGNGRLSRLLMNRLLYDAGYKFVKYISVTKFLVKQKDEYIKSLEYRNIPWANKTLTPKDLVLLFNVILDTLILSAKQAKELSQLSKINKEQFYNELKVYKDQMSFSLIRQRIKSSLSDATYKKWIKELVDQNKLEKTGEKKSTVYKINN